MEKTPETKHGIRTFSRIKETGGSEDTEDEDRIMVKTKKNAIRKAAAEKKLSGKSITGKETDSHLSGARPETAAKRTLHKKTGAVTASDIVSHNKSVTGAGTRPDDIKSNDRVIGKGKKEKDSGQIRKAAARAGMIIKILTETDMSKNVEKISENIARGTVRKTVSVLSRTFVKSVKIMWSILKKVIVLCGLWILLLIPVIAVVIVACTDMTGSSDITSYNYSYNGRVSVKSSETSEIIGMTDTEVWQLISGGRYRSYDEANRAAAGNYNAEKKYWMSLLVSVSVPCWKWADADDYSKGKVSSTVVITVNRYLEQYFVDFMTDLYNLPEQYVITDIGGFSWRKKNNGTGTSKMSAHSFGAVLDINWTIDGMGSYAAWGTESGIPWNTIDGLSEPSLSCCCTYGSSWQALAAEYDLDWGGSWSRGSLDPMHFSLVGDNKKGQSHTLSPSDPGRTP